MDKQSLRHIIREYKKTLSAEELARKSSNAITALKSNSRFQQAATVCLYASLADEVDTTELIEHHKRKKRILLPSVKGDDIELHEYGMFDTTLIGDFGITESCGTLFTDYDSIDLVIVPGMAFDKNGNRLGRGKGYYDKLLSRIKAHKVGLCFDFQMVNSVPTQPHDIRMDEVIHSASAPATPSDGRSKLPAK